MFKGLCFILEKQVCNACSAPESSDHETKYELSETTNFNDL